MASWAGRPDREISPLGPLDWLRFAGRMAWFLVLTSALLLPYLAFAAAARRGWRTGIPRWIVRTWAKTGVWVSGLTVETQGEPMEMGGARVMNHSSWADIFTLLATGHMYFIAKSEVKGWPLIGPLARLTGTMFVERRRQAAGAQQEDLRRRIAAGDRLGFFPEGTSSDGRQVLPFKSTLFAAFMEDDVAQHMWIQPVSVCYHAGPGLETDAYGWWGGMSFFGHFSEIVGKARGGVARVTYHPAVRVTDFADRKALAAHCEAAVRDGHAAAQAALLHHATPLR